jgi:hypothetical protein
VLTPTIGRSHTFSPVTHHVSSQPLPINTSFTITLFSPCLLLLCPQVPKCQPTVTRCHKDAPLGSAQRQENTREREKHFIDCTHSQHNTTTHNHNQHDHSQPISPLTTLTITHSQSQHSQSQHSQLQLAQRTKNHPRDIALRLNPEAPSGK